MTKITTHVDPEGNLHVSVAADVAIDRIAATALAYIVAGRMRAVAGKGEVGALRALPSVSLGDYVEYSYVDEGYQ